MSAVMRFTALVSTIFSIAAIFNGDSAAAAFGMACAIACRQQIKEPTR